MEVTADHAKDNERERAGVQPEVTGLERRTVGTVIVRARAIRIGGAVPIIIAQQENDVDQPNHQRNSGHGDERITPSTRCYGLCDQEGESSDADSETGRSDGQR